MLYLYVYFVLYIESRNGTNKDIDNTSEDIDSTKDDFDNTDKDFDTTNKDFDNTNKDISFLMFCSLTTLCTNLFSYVDLLSNIFH